MKRLLLFVVALLPRAAFAEPAPTDAAFFESRVRPILQAHCFDCHGPDEQKRQLRLDSTLGILRGGDSGEPLFAPGRGDDSLLLQRLSTANPKERMPPDGERLTDEQIQIVRRWIEAGARLPGDERAAAELRPKTDHWSFQPVVRPASAGAGREIDGFIEARLREKGLTPSPAADRETLIRRLYLVMHGLPPAPREVDEFLADDRDDAYARLVDRVLASRRYGERWARHWMDVVRYADTNGFETNRERKTAYHYRDYLIESFNADKPYDQFVKEQIAGDALGADAATGFLVAGPYDIVKSSDVNLTLMQRQDELADMVNTTGTAFLGLTMGCARCHNHKFDPILQKDYYAMQAVFAGVKHGERPHAARSSPEADKQIAALREDEASRHAALDGLRRTAAAAPKSPPGAAASTGRRPPVSAKFNEDGFVAVEATAVRFVILAANSGQPCLDELEVYDAAGRNVALAAAGAKATASGSLPGHAIHKLEHVHDGRTGNSHSWISNTNGAGWVRIDFAAPTRIQRVVWSRDRSGQYSDRLATRYVIEAATGPGKWQTVAGSDDREPFGGRTAAAEDFVARLAPEDARTARRLQKELDELRARLTQLASGDAAWIGRFDPRPEKTYRLYRGEPTQKRELVAPDAIAVLGSLGLSLDEPEQRRRVRLAEWIASGENPLTARVMVNRLWHYTFGVGLVDTPSDFGANGGRPTHPELLDWLADEFVRSGWSVKQMHRRILLSATFQRSSAPRAEAASVDADARFLWRYPPRRLEAEAIRDSILAVSGALDLRMGGLGFYLLDVQRENVVHYFPKETYTPAEFRRMVYLFRVRAAHDGVFGSFDCPDGSSTTARRSRSNTPLQALNLFNSSFVVQQADLLARRLAAEAGDRPEAQTELAFRLCFARRPDPFERSRSEAMIREHGLAAFARALVNTSEFLFVF